MTTTEHIEAMQIVRERQARKAEKEHEKAMKAKEQPTYKLIPHDERISIPVSVAVCPYCGGKLTVQLDTWTQLDDGSWGAMEDETPHVDCENEPEFFDDEHDASEGWLDWYASHSKMPYVYQLPVEVKVAKWLNANYRFDMDKSAR